MKWLTVLMLLLAAELIGGRSPLIALMLPTLAWRFTGTVEFYWDWYCALQRSADAGVAMAAMLDVPRRPPDRACDPAWCAA